MCCVVCQADDLGDADGEEDEGCECREELEDAEDMENKIMSSAPRSICAGIGVMMSH
jgi:hypothetical protein